MVIDIVMGIKKCLDISAGKQYDYKLTEQKKAKMVLSRGRSSYRERESSAESFLKFRETREFHTGAA